MLGLKKAPMISKEGESSSRTCVEQGAQQTWRRKRGFVILFPVAWGYYRIYSAAGQRGPSCRRAGEGERIMARLLITGASGFLGWNLARSLRAGHEIRGTFYRNPVPIEGCAMDRADLSSGEGLAEVVEAFAPDAIIHAAALIDIDLCEREREMARAVNEEGTRGVARIAAEAGARMIYFSTDMVFDGERGMYGEEDEPRPINYYGETKLAGEKWVFEYCPAAVVMRVSLIYGRGNGVHESFLGRMLKRLERGETFPVFTDQCRTPTFVKDICAAVGIALEDDDIGGLYHVSGPENLSRHEMGKEIVRVFGFPEDLIRPLKMADLEGFMPRPRDISLDNGKAAGAFGLGFTGFGAGLEAVKEEYGKDELRS